MPGKKTDLSAGGVQHLTLPGTPTPPSVGTGLWSLWKFPGAMQCLHHENSFSPSPE